MTTTEIQLLLCCARPVVDEATAARIRSLIEEGDVDWTCLIELALRHGVTPLVRRTLDHACPEAVPGELLDALRVHVKESSGRVQHLADELSGIVEDCRRRGVSVIPFKGPTLAVVAYGEMALRRPGDLDVMVHEANLPAMHEVLAARGFRRTDGPEEPLPEHLEAAYRRYQGEQIFLRQSDMVVVEPQWSIGARTLAYPIDYGAMWDRAHPVAFNGDEIPGFALEDLLLLLCVHGTKHYWPELRWIADIAALVANQPALDLEKCLADARPQGCERMVLLGLALADALLGVDLPPPLCDRIEADAACVRLVGETIESLFREDNNPPGPFSVTRYRLRSRERLRDRALCVMRCVLTPRVKHFSLVRLPPALSFLYCPVKVVHDYLLLPAWLGLKFIRSQRVRG